MERGDNKQQTEVFFDRLYVAFDFRYMFFGCDKVESNPNCREVDTEASELVVALELFD